MIEYKTTVFDSHLDLISKRVNESISDSTTQEELYVNLYNNLSNIYTNAYAPMMVRRYLSGRPDIDSFNDTIEEAVTDIVTIGTEHMALAENLRSNFNDRQNQKNSMLARLTLLNNTVDDALFINGQLPSNNMMAFRDSFNNTDLIDLAISDGMPSEISTKEGISRLNVSDVTNLSENLTVSKLEGRGEYGNAHLVQINTGDKVTPVVYKDPLGSDTAALFDNDPSTYLEYAMVGLKEADMKNSKYYDMAWAVAAQTDALKMRLVLTLIDAQVINMIDLVPFFNVGQTPRLTVISIRSSLDGSDYQPLFTGPIVVNPNLNILPDTYVAKNLYLEGTSAKLAGSGVFVIPPTEVKFIEIMIEQSQSYQSQIGHTYYKQSPLNTDEGTKSDNWLVIRSADVTQDIIDADPGRFSIPVGSDSIIIEKGIEVLDGWRYSIGIKDIGIYKFTYQENSELTSIKYTTGDPIKKLGKAISKIYLESDELIPPEFQDKVATRNSYITYFISFDDQEWIPISPIHRMPFAAEVLPSKLIEIDPIRTSINSAVNASKYSYISTSPIYGFRLKAVFKRPAGVDDNDEIKYFSPILEEYRVKVELI